MLRLATLCALALFACTAHAKVEVLPLEHEDQGLVLVARVTEQIAPGDILAFVTLRNERVRLPYFLEYYRRIGVGHFLIVDNGSDDGSRDLLAGQNPNNVQKPLN